MQKVFEKLLKVLSKQAGHISYQTLSFEWTALVCRGEVKFMVRCRFLCFLVTLEFPWCINLQYSQCFHKELSRCFFQKYLFAKVSHMFYTEAGSRKGNQSSRQTFGWSDERLICRSVEKLQLKPRMFRKGNKSCCCFVIYNSLPPVYAHFLPSIYRNQAGTWVMLC